MSEIRSGVAYRADDNWPSCVCVQDSLIKMYSQKRMLPQAMEQLTSADELEPWRKEEIEKLEGIGTGSYR